MDLLGLATEFLVLKCCIYNTILKIVGHARRQLNPKLAPNWLSHWRVLLLVFAGYSWLLYRKNRGIFLPECASCSSPKQGSPPLYVDWPGYNFYPFVPNVLFQSWHLRGSSSSHGFQHLIYSLHAFSFWWSLKLNSPVAHLRGPPYVFFAVCPTHACDHFFLLGNHEGFSIRIQWLLRYGFVNNYSFCSIFVIFFI